MRDQIFKKKNLITKILSFILVFSLIYSFVPEISGTTERASTEPRDVQFKITKTWQDLNNEAGVRPAAITVEIYGTNIEGATIGGELLKEVTLTGLEAEDFNIWEKTTEPFETTYNYFYVKERNVNSNYSVSISPLEKVEASAVNKNAPRHYEPNGGISTFAGGGPDKFSYYFIKTWNDNNDAAGKRPEYITINLLYNTTHYSTNPDDYSTLLKFNLYEDKAIILEDTLDRLSEDEYQTSDWEILLDLAYDDQNFYFMAIEEPVKNYSVEYYDSPMSDGNHIKFATEMTNTYTPEPPELYSVNITNTIRQESQYDFEINKSWDDESNILGLRPQNINIEIYGTETPNATSGGELLITVPLSAADSSSVTPNIWSKNVTVQTDYPFFYAKEVAAQGSSFGDYILTHNKITKLDNIGVENYYYVDLTNKLTVTTFNVQKTWKDNNDPYKLRPESVDFVILQNNKPYKTITLTKNDASGKNTWLKENVSVPTFDKNENPYNYTIQELNINNYTSSSYYSEKYEGAVRIYFEEIDLPKDMYDFYIVYEKNNKFYQIEVAISGSYVGQYINGKKCIEVPVSEFYFWYGFSNSKNLTANGIKVESIEKIPSTTKTGYVTPYFDKTYYEAMSNFEVIQDVTNVQVDVSKHEDIGITNPFYGDKLWKFNGYASNMFVITNTALPPDTLNITKIWNDENNKYQTRPESLNVNIYQNGVLFKTISFTKDFATTNTNIWKTLIEAPTSDANGNKYVYTIIEDESNLNLQYYYYKGDYDQSTLTITNTGIWLPPITPDEIPTHTISIEKTIVNSNNQIANSTDFFKLNLKNSNNCNFVITLKQLNRVVSKGPTGMIENYQGYSGKLFTGIISNNQGITFSNIEAGKYEISENAHLLFDFMNLNTISSSENISLTNENGKYYITISGFTTEDEHINIKLTNMILPEIFYVDIQEKKNIFRANS